MTTMIQRNLSVKTTSRSGPKYEMVSYKRQSKHDFRYGASKGEICALVRLSKFKGFSLYLTLLKKYIEFLHKKYNRVGPL